MREKKLFGVHAQLSFSFGFLIFIDIASRFRSRRRNQCRIRNFLGSWRLRVEHAIFRLPGIQSNVLPPARCQPFDMQRFIRRWLAWRVHHRWWCNILRRLHLWLRSAANRHCPGGDNDDFTGNIRGTSRMANSSAAVEYVIWLGMGCPSTHFQVWWGRSQCGGVLHDRQWECR